MGLSVLSYPRYVIIQSTQPTNAPDGSLWADTSTSPAKIKVYSSSSGLWSEISNDMTYLRQLINENSLEILENDASNSLAGDQSAYMIRDIYSDATGFLNTVDTATTTGIFTTDNYNNNANGPPTDETNAGTYPTINSTSTKNGWHIIVNADDLLLNSITKISTATPTTAYLFSDTAVLIASATFIGDTATFSTPQLLSATLGYFIETDGDGAIIDHYYQATFSETGTYFNWDYGSNTESLALNSFDIISANISLSVNPSNLLVQTLPQTIDSGMANFQPYTYNGATAGTGAITYDVSFDGGTNWQTGIAEDTATAITNTGTSLILKQNLSGVGAGNTAQAEGFGVMFW